MWSCSKIGYPLRLSLLFYLKGKENCELAENIQTRGITVVDSICPSHLLIYKMEMMICIIIGLLIGIYSELNSG